MAVPKDRRVMLGAVAVVSAAGLLLSGCSDDPGGSGGEGTTPATSSASASPSGSAGGTGGEGSGSASPSDSPSTSPTGEYEPATSEGPAKNVPIPEMPDAVKEPTEEGLEAAVKYWWETADYLRQTGDPSAFQSVSGDGCQLCISLVDRWSEVYKLGGWAVGGESEIDFQFAKLSSDNQRATAFFLLTEASGELYKPDGVLAEDASNEGVDKQPWTASLSFDEGQGAWVVDEIGIQQ